MSGLFKSFNSINDQVSLTSDAGPALLSLDSVMEKVLKNYEAGIKSGAIVFRTEPLPRVQGDEPLLTKLFEHIFSIVTRKTSPFQSKQLLHVDCKADAPGAPGLTGFRNFRIGFNTNIRYNFSGMAEHEHKLAECRNILLQHKGSMQIDCTGEGCLLNVLIPGKL
jgi:light-regulated signal transduction histidine kinase (bacteriophytochrome)